MYIYIYFFELPIKLPAVQLQCVSFYSIGQYRAVQGASSTQQQQQWS